MYYGAKPMQKPGEDTSYPAIIDTGSSQLSIPPDVFEKIRQEWAMALPNLEIYTKLKIRKMHIYYFSIQALLKLHLYLILLMAGYMYNPTR